MRSTDSLLHAAEPGLPPPPRAPHRAQAEIVIPVRNEDRERTGAGPGGRPSGLGEVASQLARFVLVGVASTVAFVVLYLLFRGVMTAQAANAASLLLTAIANTAVNRRFTFGIRGRDHAARHQLRGLIAFGVGLAVTSGALAGLHVVTTQPGRAAEVAVLVAANLTATVVRFLLYRGWVFRSAKAAPVQPAQIQPNGSAR
jgi:putative flippase GtrA